MQNLLSEIPDEKKYLGMKTSAEAAPNAPTADMELPLFNRKPAKKKSRS